MQVLTETTADLTFALVLAVARRIVESDQYLRAGKYKSWAPQLLLGQVIALNLKLLLSDALLFSPSSPPFRILLSHCFCVRGESRMSTARRSALSALVASATLWRSVHAAST